MKAKCAVTFEFESRAPLTWRGETKGASAATICRRAIAIAAKELQPRNWSSMNCCILERDNVKSEEEELDAEETDEE